MFANAGTSLMWFEFFWLTWANVLLGVLEGSVIACVWRVALRRSVSVMVAANFASSWAGAAVVSAVARADITVANLQAWALTGLGAMFVLTLLVELPFVRGALASRTTNWRRAVSTTLRVHAISYPLLLAVGWWWGDLRLLSEWTVVPATKLARPGTHVVFYVDPKSAQVWRRDLVAGGEVAVAELADPRRHCELFLEDQPGARSSLHVWLDRGWSSTVIAALPGLVGPVPDESQREVFSLTAESQWRFERGYRGLVCTGPGHERLVSLETPLSRQWQLGPVTHIADDLAMVRLSDQICLIKASTGEVALVARGRGATIAAVRP